MRSASRIAALGLAAFGLTAIASCGPGAVAFGVSAAEANSDPQTETSDPAELETTDANLVILLETTSHADVTSAEVAVGHVDLIRADGSRVRTSVNRVLPVDLATLDGDCCVVTANRLAARDSFVKAEVALEVASVLDSYGQTLQLNDQQIVTIDLAETMESDFANTLVIKLDLANNLMVDSNGGSAAWNNQLDVGVISFEGGSYDLAQLPVQSVGGTLASVSPEEGVMRLAVTPDQLISVPVIMREGVTVENEFGRGEIIDVQDDVDFTFWPQQNIVLDGTHVNPNVAFVRPADGGEGSQGGEGGSTGGGTVGGGGTTGGGQSGGGGEPGGGSNGGGDPVDVPDPGDPTPPNPPAGSTPPPENPDNYGEHPDDVEVEGGASRVVRTTWDPLMRGIVTGVYAERFEMLVITTIGPGSPDVFTKVDVTWRSDAFWTREDDRRDAQLSVGDLAIGQEVLVNTLPMGNNTFEADRVEFLTTEMRVQVLRHDGEGNTVVNLRRVEGVEPGVVGPELFADYLIEGVELPISSALAKPTISIEGRFLAGSRTIVMDE